MKNYLNISSDKELEFVIFCLDFVAEELQKPVEEVYRKLNESGLLQDYLIANYEVLHTLGKAYLVDDIIHLMKERELL